VSPASWEELRGGVTRALAGALIGEPPAIVLPDAPPAGAADELWLRALAAAAFLPRLALPEELVAAALGDLRRKPAAAGASAARRYLHARAAVAAALRAGDRLDDAGWAQLPFAARPLEAEAWKEDGAWFAGLDLLVAPVLAPDQRGRRVYFPAGRWLDVRDLGPRTGAPPARTGPRREAIEVPAGEVGLFVREGAGEELGRALWKALHGP
jgi:hypothetical protein